MRYIWTIIWSLLLTNMSFYVLSSMQGGEYHFTTACIIGFIFALFVIILGEAGVKDPETE